VVSVPLGVREKICPVTVYSTIVGNSIEIAVIAEDQLGVTVGAIGSRKGVNRCELPAGSDLKMVPYVLGPPRGSVP
jgi:hypothetical protein